MAKDKWTLLIADATKYSSVKAKRNITKLQKESTSLYSEQKVY